MAGTGQIMPSEDLLSVHAIFCLKLEKLENLLQPPIKLILNELSASVHSKGQKTEITEISRNLPSIAGCGSAQLRQLTLG